MLHSRGEKGVSPMNQGSCRRDKQLSQVHKAVRCPCFRCEIGSLMHLLPSIQPGAGKYLYGIESSLGCLSCIPESSGTWVCYMHAQRMNLDDEMKAIFLLCSLPNSWDTFCMAVSNSAPNGNLVYNNITGALLSE